MSTATLAAVDDDDGDVSLLGPGEARELTDAIKQFTNSDAVAELLVAAYDGRVWVGLSYPTWDAWRAAEFGDVPLVPNRANVIAVQRRMRADGKSYQQIAAATGSGKSTVHRNCADVLVTAGNTVDGVWQPALEGTRENRRRQVRPVKYEPRLRGPVPRIEARVDPARACDGYVVRPKVRAELQALEDCMWETASKDLTADEKNLYLRAIDRVAMHLDGKGKS